MPCSAGKFSNSTGATFCQSCPLGFCSVASTLDNGNMNQTNTGATTCRRCAASEGVCSEGTTSCAQSADNLNPFAPQPQEAVLLVTLQLRSSSNELDAGKQEIIISAVALSFNVGKDVVSILSVQMINSSLRSVDVKPDNTDSSYIKQYAYLGTDGIIMKAKSVISALDFGFKKNLARQALNLRYALNQATANNASGSIMSIVLRVIVPMKSCSQVQADQEAAIPTMRSKLQEGGLLLQAPISVETVSCPTAAENDLAPYLKKQAEVTTLVVATVVVAVVSTSVASATAGAVGMSVFSSGASAATTPGASIYQLINAVQFINVYGAMLPPSKSQTNRRDLADLLKYNISALNESGTLQTSQASKFR
jgi:hypothetical protein